MSRSEKLATAELMYRSGMSLVEIAKKLDKPEGTIRRWKCEGKWSRDKEQDSKPKGKKTESSEQKTSVRNKRERSEKNDEGTRSGLSDRQELFCQIYVQCFNATRAYQKAYGCSYEVANSNAYALMVIDGIKKRIKELKQIRKAEKFLEADDIIDLKIAIAFADYSDFVEIGEDGIARMKPSGLYDGRVIKEISDGPKGFTLKLHDADKAREWLLEHLDMLNPEQKARIENLKARTAQIQKAHEEEDDDGVEIINDAPANPSV